MYLNQFQFNLPPELIAQNPVVPRDSARLFVYNRNTGQVTHAQVRDLPSLLPANSLLVANNSRVRKARLFGRSPVGKPIELLVLEETGDQYRCMVGGRAKIGSSITVFADAARTQPAPFTATIMESENLPGMTCFLVKFSSEPNFDLFGHAPLPPYITKSRAKDEQYQTVYAKAIGSAAAPTAGLHFTPELLRRLHEANINWAEVTLHVGLGTFLPLRNEQIEDNHLHAEYTSISTDVANQINQSKHIVAVGTTSTRTLESHSTSPGVQAGDLETDMFIYPGYQFKTVHALMTNFHLPHSSLLMLVAAFLGNNRELSSPTITTEAMITLLLRLYEEAIKEKYRFFSFGDAMLIL